MVVRLSALGTGRIYPQEIIPVNISVRRSLDPRAIVRSEGFMSMKNSKTPSGIETATFWFVAQYLNHCATAVPGRRLPMNNVQNRNFNKNYVYSQLLLYPYYRRKHGSNKRHCDYSATNEYRFEQRTPTMESYFNPHKLHFSEHNSGNNFTL
jgi:hypothetical protein